jgi:hypothetical protein
VTGNGLEPNTLVLGKAAETALLTNAQVLEFLKVGGVLPSVDAIRGKLAALFGVEKIVIASAYRPTAATQYSDTPTFEPIVGKHVALIHTAPNPGWGIPSAITGFRWRPGNMGLNDNPNGIGVVRIREEKRFAWLIHAMQFMGLKKTGAGLGAIILSVTA